MLSIKKVPYLGLWLISLIFSMGVYAQSQKTISIVVLGDSISNNYGLQFGESWVSLLQQQLNQDYPKQSFSVINASISGDTTRNGLSRLPAVLENYHPQLLILELGGNDGLRGLPLEETKKNLENIITLSQKKGAHLLLLAIRMPPNYGLAYTTGFHQNYAALAQKYHLTWVPCLYTDLYGHPNLIQEDGIHPNALGQKVVLKNVYSSLLYELKLSKKKPALRDCV